MTDLLRYKSDHKRGLKYTIMVVGPSGTGKTTFVNALLDTQLLPFKYQPLSTITNEPQVMSFVGGSSYSFDSREFNPKQDFSEFTIAITKSSMEIVDEDGAKIQLSVVDTPGFGDNVDNEMCFGEIVQYLQQQFDHVLAEETRIRRNPRFEDTRVHICLYFIEPTGHGLRELDVECMKKLSKYVNVLPVISRADSFTSLELEAFKKNILYDIAKFSIPVFQFGYDEEEDDEEVIKENTELKSIQPFAIMGSKEKLNINGQLKYARQYPWGVVDVETESDFNKLKNVLFGSHLQDFKDLTMNFLYENYRTDKLSSVTESESQQFDAGNPSLSNLAALTLEDSKSGGSGEVSTPSMKSTSSFKPDDQGSPIKEIGESIKHENESIINNIKNSPRVPYSPDPSRNKLRVMSETVPYVLKHESIISRQQRLQELEEKSARELAIRAAALEKKAAELKRREKMLKSSASFTSLKKEDTMTDLSSVVKQEQ
ncbi:SHS1 [Cyberlindnera jadinii]|uniref:SHS1 protein n=1 Tax=Cyberlindnera jadinii (strain ATCC 18201 / CBS 1600 / BCRC 20928 / JCM 3617 / NBRC 0987 / NRRL Y-1542) TaxID=983966 RepID=A0A0H5CAD1_CYBJN|nr:SHS1 [Cyberlindnera jadinii]